MLLKTENCVFESTPCNREKIFRGTLKKLYYKGAVPGNTFLCASNNMDKKVTMLCVSSTLVFSIGPQQFPNIIYLRSEQITCARRQAESGYA